MKSSPLRIVAVTMVALSVVATNAFAAQSNNTNHTSTKHEKVLHGNYSSGIYHNAYCRYYNCKKCTVVFSSAKEAQKRGYRACKKCGG